ncbi:uncharacterized protein [Montipora capricornis]|uniref:uncharacterized protein n=1 Tax=Montipora capricornis TaxID=246305 RepID=UPI0035F18D11
MAAALRKENQELKQQIQTLSVELENLKSLITHQRAAESHETRVTSLDAETKSNLKFYSKEYDDLSKFRRQAQSEIQRLSTRLTEISSKVDAVCKAVGDELQDCSYHFNVKIINVPEIKQQETAREKSDLCVALFNGMGAVVSLQDLDVAHRVPRRNQDGGPKPMICKFIRRLATFEVMNRRRDACKVDPNGLGFSEDVSLGAVRIFDHLSPRLQQVLYEAKKFKDRNNYQYCWAKDSVVYLRRDSESRPIKIKDLG